MRIAPDGSDVESYGCTDGFIAGIAFDGKGGLFACDIRFGCVYRLDIASRALKKFGTVSFDVPNFPVVDLPRNSLYVTDSFSFDEPGPGVWRYDLSTGEADLWHNQSMAFANGMALGLDGQSLFIVESKERKVTRLEINPDGSAGSCSTYAENLGAFPDGLSFDADGNLYVSCYEPSEIYRVTPDGETELLIKDPEATLIAHATNTAFRGSDLFSTNLGRWHITKIDLGVQGAALPLKY